MFDAKTSNHKQDLIDMEFVKDFLRIPNEVPIEQLLYEFGEYTTIEGKWYMTLE